MHVILLLSSRQADLTAALFHLTPVVTGVLTQLPFLPQAISVCSRQGLSQDHLTVWENIQLVATLYGIRDEDKRLGDLLAATGLASQSRMPVGNLTRLDRRRLHLVLSLLLAPDTLLIDNLADGLVAPAQQVIWNFMRRASAYGVKGMIYATHDLTAIARLKPDEVWLLQEGQLVRYWLAGQLPPALREPAAFAFEFRTAKAAEYFHKKLVTSPGVFKLIKSDWSPNVTPTVRVVTEAHDAITDLTLAAGSYLLNFYDLPLEVDVLPAGWLLEKRPISPPPLRRNQRVQSYRLPWPQVQLSGRQRIRALITIARAEYRRHFRRLWKGLNVLLSNVLPFGLLVALTEIPQTAAVDFFLLAAVMLVASAAMCAVWGIEIMSHLKLTTVEDGGQTAPARPRNLPLLALYDRTPLDRGTLLAGLLLGQFLILLTHALPLLLLSSLLWQNWLLTFIAWFSWLAVAVSTFALIVWLSQFVRWPVTSFGLGILSYLGLLSSVVALNRMPDGWLPFTWVWPVTGFVAVFRAMTAPDFGWSEVLAPLALASTMTALFWYKAIRSYFYPGNAGAATQFN